MRVSGRYTGIAGRTMRPIVRDAGLRLLLRMRRRLSRPVSAGVRVAPQCRNFARSGGFHGPRQASFLQFPADPGGSPVSPANHGQPSKGASKCDKRRHRSILVHWSRPWSHFLPSRLTLQRISQRRNGAAYPCSKPEFRPNCPAFERRNHLFRQIGRILPCAHGSGRPPPQ